MFLNEIVGIWQVIGGAMILTGVVMAEIKER
jgi:drug/metabolite transporter (DMT)-like permease